MKTASDQDFEISSRFLRELATYQGCSRSRM